MQVRVLYFGVLKERCGRAEEPVELAEGATVAELVRVLRERTSKPAMGKELGSATGSPEDRGAEPETGLQGLKSEGDVRLWRSLAVAVNREYALADAVLRDGDEVALLPPVSGGCFAQGEDCADGESLAPLAAAGAAAVARPLLAAAELVREAQAMFAMECAR